MKVDTRWFGTVDIDDEKIITFDLGVIGFEDCKKFTLIYDVDKGDEASIMVTVIRRARTCSSNVKAGAY